MTGKGLFVLLSLDYEKIGQERKKDEQESLNHFKEELKKIPEYILNFNNA